ncbi:signal recognition particle protein [Acholeplasma equifetale]|uniref:signal recognition particle protein n=1 Tax=Acholeplasma equifetale TaxID=264634 RepID=UPI003CCBFFDC
MMKNSLSDRLQMFVRRATGRGRLNENDIEEMMREVRLALLEADVNFKIVKEFTKNVKEKALGETILKGLNPGQQVVKIVHEELKRIMGEETVGLNFASSGLTKIMTIGLQGSGKTTAIGKLGLWIRKNYKKKILFVAADIYRPAAINQLETIGKQLAIDVYKEDVKDARKIVKNGLNYAKENKYDVIIVDTAGRLTIDEDMMQELKDVKDILEPNDILLTVDAMMGQEAANVAKSFHDQIGATGVILTKLDGDTRGGAALSVREVANIPIKFASSGEKMDTIEVFHPDRMASRILGMGDVLTLIEEVTSNIDEDEAKSLMEKMMSDSYNYLDLQKQFKMIKRMGSITKLLGFIPGLGKMKDAISQVDEKQFDKINVIIQSMTEDERKYPELIDKSARRRDRIAKGAGVQVADVNRLREMLEQQKKLMKQMSKMDEKDFEKISRNPNALQPQVKPKKGKGKGKGNFRF